MYFGIFLFGWVARIIRYYGIGRGGHSVYVEVEGEQEYNTIKLIIYYKK